MKILLLSALIIFTTLPSFAFEDCLISNTKKLSDIRIENNEIIDVFPLITIMNDKNTIIVHPLKEGSTRFSVLQDNKNIILFSVKVDSEKTIIDEVEDFSIMAIDSPPVPFEYELDTPPWTKL